MKQLIGPIAQRLEQSTHNALVPGSNPGGPTNDDNIIDAEFEEIYEPGLMERMGQIAFYKYVQTLRNGSRTTGKLVDFHI